MHRAKELLQVLGHCYGAGRKKDGMGLELFVLAERVTLIYEQPQCGMLFYRYVEDDEASRSRLHSFIRIQDSKPEDCSELG